jgi:LmbE family N-acetylglucosaminyl deacetylase
VLRSVLAEVELELLFMTEVVLVVAPHPDDESIGCGGTICLHRQRGDSVHVVFLTSGELGLKDLPRDQAWQVRQAEAENAAGVLGVSSLTFLRLRDWFLAEQIAQAAIALRPLLQKQAPVRIYVPHARDGHPDHRAAAPIVRAALRELTGPVPAVLGYEVWTPLADFDHVEDISALMRQKLRAIRCYRSQLSQFRYDFAIRGLNRFRGAIAGRCRYAEVFSAIPLDMRLQEI